MKLVHPSMEMQIEIFEYEYAEWIIESPAVMSFYLEELLNQEKGEEGNFVLSSENVIMEISKSVEVIINPFAVDVNEKRILNKVYDDIKLKACSEEYYLMMQELSQNIFDFLYSVTNQCEYFVSSGKEIDFSCLLKSAGIKIEEHLDNFLMRLSSYMELLHHFLHKQLFIMVNLRSYVDDRKLEEFIKSMQYKEIGIVFLENQQRDCLNDIKQYIIDKDQCEIY